MTIYEVAGTGEAEAPLLDCHDVVSGSVDYKGRPSVRSKSGCWKSSPFVIGVGVAERFSYFGVSGNLVSYLTGKLGQPTATAAAMMNAWFGVSSLLPVVGALLADSFTGRFRMIIASCVLYVSGLTLLVVSASLNTYDPSKCQPVGVLTSACHPDQVVLIFFFSSLYLVSLAQGGFTPCVQAFGADQFDDADEYEGTAKSSYFNWWYCALVGGILVPLTIVNYIQDNVSWVLGFAISAVVMCFALALFFFGIPTYRFQSAKNTTNPFLRIHRVFVQAVKNWKASPAPSPASVEEDGLPILPRQGSQFKFLDKALLAPDQDEKHGAVSVDDVEDAKGILRLIPVWFACLGYSIVYAQPSTLFTKQATTLDRVIFSSLQLPAASLQNCFTGLSIAIMLPIYDRVFVPMARAITKKPSGITTLQRIGVGLTLSLISMVFAAVVERRRLAVAREHGMADMPDAVVPMGFWWLAPQYVVSGVADVFAMVGLQEFFYEEVPAELKSIGLALYASILGVGSLLSSAMVSTIQNATRWNGEGGWFSDNLNRAHLDYFYWVLTAICAAGFVLFLFYAKYFYVYRRKGKETQ
ncbi:protein NRT1/ PTR FAMILY 5.10-like [Andrographis paniculata]|uniref:protein NRT1/ PTR FAMILY 5.10-like n=1 Tax=Andrographis paniculata TaxID=175694 RepID=UPI0021E8B7E1|nr:protein NRT1/ PTR FAMILY 5.10-like [Andrographis paniculata]